jgi:ribA/ribD-fused uncharacterized protein
MTIFFYKKNESPYGCFSNFFEAPMPIGEKLWPTVEHYYQAMKLDGHPDLQEIIRTTRNPPETKKIANVVHNQVIDWKHWHEIKYDIMIMPLRENFRQNPQLGDILLSTGEEEIVEHTKHDFH